MHTHFHWLRRRSTDKKTHKTATTKSSTWWRRGMERRQRRATTEIVGQKQRTNSHIGERFILNGISDTKISCRKPHLRTGVISERDFRRMVPRTENYLHCRRCVCGYGIWTENLISNFAAPHWIALKAVVSSLSLRVARCDRKTDEVFKICSIKCLSSIWEQIKTVPSTSTSFSSLSTSTMVVVEPTRLLSYNDRITFYHFATWWTLTATICRHKVLRVQHPSLCVSN